MDPNALHPEGAGPVVRAATWLLAAAFLTVGCGDSEPADGPARERYIAAYVEILSTAAAAADSAAAAESTVAVLERRALTVDDLMAFARAHADDPGYLASVWREIERRLREGPDEGADPIEDQ